MTNLNSLVDTWTTLVILFIYLFIGAVGVLVFLSLGWILARLA